MSSVYNTKNLFELYHHGILGQKWGKRNGPPYPLSGGQYSNVEKRYMSLSSSINKKRYHDTILKKGSTIHTLSYDPNRTKNADMFYGAVKKSDRRIYMAMFNKKIPKEIYDEKGNSIGTGMFYKYDLSNRVANDMKIASESSSVEGFKKLYSTNRDFYNYVKDPGRMEAKFVKSKYKYKGYREAKKALEKLRTNEGAITSDDLAKIYRLYNYTIPNEDSDTLTQRTKFFKEMKSRGYQGILDTNDALYGSFKADNPIIVFDQSSLVPEKAMQTNVAQVAVSRLVLPIIMAFNKRMSDEY